MLLSFLDQRRFNVLQFQSPCLSRSMRSDFLPDVDKPFAFNSAFNSDTVNFWKSFPIFPPTTHLFNPILEVAPAFLIFFNLWLNAFILLFSARFDSPPMEHHHSCKDIIDFLFNFYLPLCRRILTVR